MLIKAARKLLGWGPQHILIKKGEHGAVLFSKRGTFLMPAYPLEAVNDPTGAGDCFAGAFTGYLAKVGKVNATTLRNAVIYGSVIASFNVEAFSLGRLQTLTPADIDNRYQAFRQMSHFELH